MGKIFYVMGKSSSGKDSLYKEIRKIMIELRPVVMYTTRPIREGEREGQEYFFVSEKECEQLCDAGKVIELRTYHTIHGPWKYFTVADQQIDLERQSNLMIGTLESYEKMREYLGQDVLIPIYINVEDGERLSRALSREKSQVEPKYKEMCRRFLADCEDFSVKKIESAGIDKIFENNDFTRCLQEILLYIRENI